jgi:pyruvate carboxylase
MRCYTPIFSFHIWIKRLDLKHQSIIEDKAGVKPYKHTHLWNIIKTDIKFLKLIIKQKAMSETRWEKNNHTKLLFFSFNKIQDSEGKTLIILASVRTEKPINKKSFSCLVEAAKKFMSHQTKSNKFIWY